MIFLPPILTAEEIDVIGQIEEFRDKLKLATRQARRWKGILLRGAFARAIQGSNAIEGYNVTYEDAVAAIANEEPLEAGEEAWEEIKGYRDAMTYVLQLSEERAFTYSIALIKSLHFMMLKHTLAKHPGRWRPGYIHVSNEATGERVYEGPDIDMVPHLADELVSFLNSSDERPIIKAAMAHLNFTMIHPFSDGNGRMARVLQSLVLSRQGILEPEFCSIEEYLGAVRPDYYRVLAQVGQGHWNPERDSRPWIRFCLQAHFRQGQRLLRRTKEYERVWAELEAEARRRGLPDRTVFALFDAAFGYKVRNATYRVTAEVSENLASRDLKILTDQKLLIAKGEKRGRFYVASDEVSAIRANTREQTRTPEPEKVRQLWRPGSGS